MEDSTRAALRASEWDEFIGQDSLKQQLDIRVVAARKNGETLDPVLLAGPPGFGKTTMARIIASRLGDPFTAVKMPIRPIALERLARRFEGGVLFLDEIHAASKSQQEDLLTVLEEGYLSTGNGRRIHLEWCSIVAATTEPEKLIAPLTQRFKIKPYYDPYSDEEMGQIVAGMARRAELDLPDDECVALGRATGGTPRVAEDFVLAARALASAHERTPSAEEVLLFCRVEPDGLTLDHLAYLRCLDQLGSVAGMRTLRGMLRKDEATLREIERLLVERGYVVPTERGRELLTPGQRRIASREPRVMRRAMESAR